MYPHYSPITNQGTTNILPVVYPAIVAIIGDEEVVRNIVNAYIRQNEIKDLNSTYFVPNDFETHYLKRRDFFTEQCEDKGIDVTLIDYLKDKKRSMSSQNFWGFIRIAAAFNEERPERIIQAMAYHDCIAKELNVSGGAEPSINKRKSFIALMQRRRHFRGLMQAKTQEEKIKIIIQNQENLLTIGDYDSVETLEITMLETFSEWFLMTEDSHVSDVLIGFHALYQLRDILPNYKEWLEEFWVQAQVYSMLTRRSVLWKKAQLTTWDELINAAKHLNDIRDIKFFYVIYDFSRNFKLDFLRRTAQIVVGR